MEYSISKALHQVLQKTAVKNFYEEHIYLFILGYFEIESKVPYQYSSILFSKIKHYLWFGLV